MLEPLTGFPEKILAFAGHGRITRADYREILEPALEAALRHPGKLRFYYELGRDFEAFEAGAMWEDFKTGMEHFTRWERIAVVTDIAWIAQSMRAFGFLMPAAVKAFALSEKDEARGWIAQPA